MPCISQDGKEDEIISGEIQQAPDSERFRCRIFLKKTMNPCGAGKEDYRGGRFGLPLFCGEVPGKSTGSRKKSGNASFFRLFFCTLVVCQGDLKQDIVVRKMS